MEASIPDCYLPFLHRECRRDLDTWVLAKLGFDEAFASSVARATAITPCRGTLL